MFKIIMVPVDLAHVKALNKALIVAAALAKQFDSELHLVGVTGIQPSEVAHSPAEYRKKLERFAQQRSEESGVSFHAMMLESHDPAVDLDKRLASAAKELDADLIVMASHVPHFADWWNHSHARWLAAHTERSMFIVR